jgi:hypothetical protein
MTDIKINIQSILKDTPSYMVGEEVIEYASVYVASFTQGNKNYTINAVFDTDTEVKELVIANDDDIIVNEI